MWKLVTTTGSDGMPFYGIVRRIDEESGDNPANMEFRGMFTSDKDEALLHLERLNKEVGR